MGPRYLVFAGPPDQIAALGSRAARIAADHALIPLSDPFRGIGIALFAEVGGAYSCGDDEILLGVAFARGSASGPDRHKSAHPPFRDHWGAYVAILLDRAEQSVTLVRPPFGELGCYYWTDGALVVAASDVELLCAWAGAIPPIDWAAVTRHLVASSLRPAATCLKGVHELLGGTCLTVRAGACSVETVWSPWDFVAPPCEPDPDALAAELRAVIAECVGRVGRRYARVLLGLSGGLDSSIVAAALASSGVPFDCLTLVTSDPLGDERPFARAVTDALRVRLIEAPRRLAGINVARSNAAHLPRPVGRSFSQESERILIAAARASGAEAILRGGGGDNVFCYLQSVRPVADRVRVQGWPAALGTLGDVSRLTGCGLPTAFRRTLRQLGRPPAYRFAPDTSLLSAKAAAGAEEAARHPWLEVPPGALPGQAAHIALLLAMSNYMEPLAPDTDLPLLSPLMAPPIVEFCLAVPSWLWCRGGNNRAVARQAFADVLPPAIIHRRGKGSPDSFVIEIFEANRAALRALLEDGLLASHGLLDADRVRAVLADTAPVRGSAYGRVMQLADVEAWARSWTERRPPR